MVNLKTLDKQNLTMKHKMILQLRVINWLQVLSIVFRIQSKMARSAKGTPRPAQAGSKCKFSQH